MVASNYPKYDEDLKNPWFHSIKTQAQLCKEYSISQSALGKWVKLHSRCGS